MLQMTHDYVGEYRTWPEVPFPTTCRVRIYEGEGEKPVILLSASPENRGPSLTNAVEFVATAVVLERFPGLARSAISPAEAVRRWLGRDVPFTVVQHQPASVGPNGREEFSFVRFSDAAARHVGWGVRRFGPFRWESASREAVEWLVGPLDSRAPSETG
jgi:hypothetical protein